MIYKTRGKYSGNLVDTAKVISCFKARFAYVRCFDEEARLELLDFLESEGFSYLVDNVRNREDIRASGYPLTIDMANKKISRLGNTTCAAAACSSKIVMGDAEFYILYAMFGHY